MSSPLDGAAARVVLLPLALILALVPAFGVVAEESGGKVPAAATGESAAGTAETADVSLPDGVTVTWNAADGRMAPPSGEQAARLAAAFRRLLLAKAAEPGFRRLARPGEIDEIALPNGMKGMRLTSDRMSFSLVRFDAEGRLVPSCADGVEAAAGVLIAPVPDAAEER